MAKLLGGAIDLLWTDQPDPFSSSLSGRKPTTTNHLFCAFDWDGTAGDISVVQISLLAFPGRLLPDILVVFDSWINHPRHDGVLALQRGSTTEALAARRHDSRSDRRSLLALGGSPGSHQ